MVDKTVIKALLRKYLEDRLTPSEYEELFAWLQQHPEDDSWTEMLAELGREQPGEEGYDRGRWQPVVERILDHGEKATAKSDDLAPVRKLAVRSRFTARYVAAAAVLAVLAGGVVLWNSRQDRLSATTGVSRKAAVRQDIAPGGNKAILTLANGSTIVLDSAADGMLARQSNVKVLKSGGNQLVYAGGAGPGEGSAGTVYNKLATPRGGQYQLTLSDGTKVWLNSASSITYPTAFSGDSREVTITGEAYLEVAHLPGQPFRVKAGGETVAVLGTDFDINTYADEPDVRTTLVDGRIRVTTGGQDRVLDPGEQIQISKNTVRLIHHADIAQALAWKNGMVKFTGADIQEIMRQISRWYDVDVQYQGDVDPTLLMGGEVSRNHALSSLLGTIETGSGGKVHFIINNKTVIVKP